MTASTTARFTLRLKQPFAFTEFLLGGSNGVVGAIMREKDALTDPYKPVQARIGSGPFRFVEAEYRAGRETRLREIRRLRAARGAGQRLRRRQGRQGRSRGVGDHPRSLGRLRRAAQRRGRHARRATARPAADRASDPNIVIGEVWPLESYAVLRFNSLWPPFNNLKARQAVAHAMSQADYMSAAYGDPKYWHECYAFWVCGSPNGTEVGSEPYRKPDLDLARKLVRESGYDGTPGGADRRLRHSRLSADEPGHRGSAAEDRLQGRPADVRLGQRRDAAAEEGSAVARAAGTCSTPAPTARSSPAR